MKELKEFKESFNFSILFLFIKFKKYEELWYMLSHWMFHIDRWNYYMRLLYEMWHRDISVCHVW